MVLTCSSTAAPRLLISCTAPRKPRLPSATIDSMASADSSATLWKMRSGSALFHRLAQRRAVGEFHGVDAGAVQHQRQELPDAGVLVDHVTERGGRPGASGGASTTSAALGRSGSAILRGTRAWKLCAFQLRITDCRSLYWCSKLVKYEFPAAGRPDAALQAKSQKNHEKIGDPGWIRTSDPQLRRLVLYPAELRGHAERQGLPAPGAY